MSAGVERDRTDVFRKRRKAHIDRITLHGAQVVTRLEKVCP